MPVRLRVVIAGDAGEDAGAAAAQARRVEARIFKRLPADFEQQPLLWVEAGRLLGRYAEKRRVEAVDRQIEKMRAGGMGPAWSVGGGAVEPIARPAFGRHRSAGVVAPAQQFPQRLRRVCTSRQAAGHADDGDRLDAARLKRLDAGLGAPEGDKCLLQNL